MTIGVAARAMTKSRQVWRRAFEEAGAVAAPDKVYGLAAQALREALGVHVATSIAGADVVVRVLVHGVELYRERGPRMDRQNVTERALARVKARDLKPKSPLLLEKPGCDG